MNPLRDMQEKANIARKHKKGDDRYRYNFYDEEVQKRNIREKELMGMVDYSLRNGDFLIYLQPKVQLENNRVAGAEALIRWKHPELGMLSPGHVHSSRRALPPDQQAGFVCF